MIFELGSDNVAKVKITGTEFTGGRLDFSRAGKPLNAGIPFSGERVLVMLNQKYGIRVTANTGFIKIIKQ